MLPPISGLTARVQLQRRETVAEPEGGQGHLYVPIVNLWARVTATGRHQVTRADGRSVTVSHTVVLRWRGDLRPGDRFRHRGRHLVILSSEDISGRRRFLTCRCVERAVTG